MKSIGIIIAVVLLSACSSTTVTKVVPIIDSPQLVYKDSTQGPYLLNGVRQIIRTFRPVNNDSTQTKGEWKCDTGYWAKIQIDTLKVPGAIHSYRYQPLDKRYVQVVNIQIPTAKTESTKPKK